MHPHRSAGIVGDTAESVFHGVEGRLSAVGNHNRFAERMPFAQLLPILLLMFGQYEDDAHAVVEVPEPAYRVHEHRQSAYRQELLWNVSPHAHPLAAGNDYHIVVILHHAALICFP